MLDTRKWRTYAQCQVITYWVQDCGARCLWQTYIHHTDTDSVYDYREPRMRQVHPHKSCNFEGIPNGNYEDRCLWYGERLNWGRVWAWFGTCKVSNLDISCRNKAGLTSRNTRKRWHSIQNADVQCHPAMQLWRVVVANGWDCKRKNLNPHEEIEMEWTRLTFLYHKRRWQRSSSQLPTEQWVRSKFRRFGKRCTSGLLRDTSELSKSREKLVEWFTR